MNGSTTSPQVAAQKKIRRQHKAGSVLVNPADYVAIVGQSFVKHERQPLLTIGNRHWDRWSLGRLGVTHTVAASRLNRVLAQLGITTLAALAAQLQDVGSFVGIGVTAYFVCLAILTEAGYEADTVHGADVTYATVKARAMKEQAKTRRLRKRS